MATETDIRLRSWLDANQRDREQMCRAILALDPHYSDVRPRHPSGGPDGGRDIEAKYDEARIAFGAVGFQNSANDGERQKKQIRKKFSEDLNSAISANSELKVFAFFTNVNFSVGDHYKMKEESRKFGFEHCDIFDLERIRIELDSPAGFFIRFQYLGISLSEAEQASFLARYGDRIQEVVSTGFQRIERTLNRLLFLEEASNVLTGITFIFRLKRSYSAAEIGHCRAFVKLYLRELKHDIFGIWFGATDQAFRFSSGSKTSEREATGIAYGIATGQWENRVKVPTVRATQAALTEFTNRVQLEPNEYKDQHLTFVGYGSSRGIDPVQDIIINYRHDSGFIRSTPRLNLRDLDNCMFLPILNHSLAQKLLSIEVFANGYKLTNIAMDEFKIVLTPCQAYTSSAFTAEELTDRWVRIRPAGFASAFRLHFSSTTPRRMFSHDEPSEHNSTTRDDVTDRDIS